MQNMVLVAVFLLLFTPSTASYKAPEPVKRSVDELISHYAEKYQVSEKVLHNVIKCESQYKEKAIGDGGRSFGIVQIFLPAHPSVSKVSALDPDFAIDFLAKNLSEGRGRLWTCWRKLYS